MREENGQQKGSLKKNKGEARKWKAKRGRKDI